MTLPTDTRLRTWRRSQYTRDQPSGATDVRKACQQARRADRSQLRSTDTLVIVADLESAPVSSL